MLIMRENVNDEASKDSSILRFVELQEACGPDNVCLGRETEQRVDRK